VGVVLGWLAVGASAAAIGAGNMLQGPPILRARTVLFVAVTLIGTGVAAGILPAIRATRIDPAVSLRSL
jgi:ABC-type antimicrobial peptide transport system permease subunit